MNAGYSGTTMECGFRRAVHYPTIVPCVVPTSVPCVVPTIVPCVAKCVYACTCVAKED